MKKYINESQLQELVTKIVKESIMEYNGQSAQSNLFAVEEFKKLCRQIRNKVEKDTNTVILLGGCFYNDDLQEYLDYLEKTWENLPDDEKAEYKYSFKRYAIDYMYRELYDECKQD